MSGQKDFSLEALQKKYAARLSDMYGYGIENGQKVIDAHFRSAADEIANQGISSNIKKLAFAIANLGLAVIPGNPMSPLNLALAGIASYEAFEGFCKADDAEKVLDALSNPKTPPGKIADQTVFNRAEANLRTVITGKTGRAGKRAAKALALPASGPI